MPNVVIPDFTLQAKPRVVDVRNAEKALVEVLGGVHEETRYAGDLDGTNIAADAGFLLAQQAEPNHRIVVAAGRTEDLAPEGAMPDIAGPKCIVSVPMAIDVDTLHFWHSDPLPLTGKVTAYRNGVGLTDINFPGGGVARGEIAEFPFPLRLLADDELEFRWLDGVNQLKTLAGAAPSAYSRAFLSLWGVAPHIV